MEQYLEQLNAIISNDNLNITYNITLDGSIGTYNGDFKKVRDKINNIIDSILAVKPTNDFNGRYKYN